MFCLKAVLQSDVLNEVARDLYREGAIDLEQAIALTIAASLNKLACNGIEISFNEYSEHSFPVHIVAYDDDGRPIPPSKVQIVEGGD